MDTNSAPKLRMPKVLRLSSWVKLIQHFDRRILSPISRSLQLAIEKLIYLGGINESIAVKWLLRVYKSKFRLDWEFSKIPPHFYDHRMGMAEFAFSERTYGCYSYYRGFYSSEVIRANDSLLDIGCGDGFFTKRFLSTKSKHVDGIDIEPSAIECAKRNNSAENIKYHILDAVAVDFPQKNYDVIVWDGAIGHFSPNTLDTVLAKIANTLSKDGVFVGSESLGREGSDHLTQFDSLDDLGNLFLKYFRYVEVSSQDYEINGNFIRQEAYWRCANQPDRIQSLTWKKYYRK